MKPIDINLPTFGFVVMTRALLGMGIGLLVAGRLTDEQRRAVGLTLVAVGAATACAVHRAPTASAAKTTHPAAPDGYRLPAPTISSPRSTGPPAPSLQFRQDKSPRQ